MDQQHETTTDQPPVEASTTPQPVGKNKRKLLALWLLIGPTALIIGSLILFAILNFIFGATNEPYEPSVIKTIFNMLLFVVGAVSVMAWLPGIIVGIILLTTQRKS